MQPNFCEIFLKSIDMHKKGLTEKARIYRDFAYAYVSQGVRQ